MSTEYDKEGAMEFVDRMVLATAKDHVERRLREESDQRLKFEAERIRLQVDVPNTLT